MAAFKPAALAVGCLLTLKAVAASRCSGLFEISKELIPGLEPYVSRNYPAGAFTESPSGVVPNLAEFCRFGAEYNTSDISTVQFELWLPSAESWNGRFAFVGNLGFRGEVNVLEMGVPLTKYGFAVASTNGGHNGTIWDGTFSMNNPESQIDFGYQAVRLSTVFSKKLVQEYYEKPAEYSYWMGCSTGGRQGLKEAQEYPEDYDGLLIGAPSNWWSRLAGYLTWASRANEPENTPGEFVPPSFFSTWAQEVRNQCDELDGVKDNVISKPENCKPDASTLVCGSNNPSALVDSTTCISEGQAVTLEAVYQDWTSVVDGSWMFSGFVPGSEDDWHVMISGQPPEFAQDYFSYLVYNHTSLQAPLRLNATELERVVRIADTTNPGGYTAVNTNLTPFFSRGGRIIEYHGLSDGYIPAGSSTDYYNKVKSFLEPSNIADRYRLFMVPGMSHCWGGTGTDGFGRANQHDDSLGGGGQSLKSDPEHDAVLALMQWVERGDAPESIIGTKYINNNRSEGVEFTRLLCPYPQEAKFIAGDTSTSTSYRCEGGLGVDPLVVQSN